MLWACFRGWSATGAFYSRLSPVANSVEITPLRWTCDACIAIGLFWMMTMNSTELFVSFCCPELSLNEILGDSCGCLNGCTWMLETVWSMLQNIHVCLYIYTYIYTHKYAHIGDDVPIYIRWLYHVCTVWDILQEWRDSRTLKNFDITTHGHLIDIRYDKQTRLLRVSRMGLAPKGTCTTLRCRISLSSSIAVLAWHQAQLMGWMMM